MEKEFYIFKMDERKITKEDAERFYIVMGRLSSKLSKSISTFLDGEVELFD